MCAVSYFSDGSMFIEPRNPPEARGGLGAALFVICVHIRLYGMWFCEFEFRDPAHPSRHNIINKKLDGPLVTGSGVNISGTG